MLNEQMIMTGSNV